MGKDVGELTVYPVFGYGGQLPLLFPLILQGFFNLVGMVI